MKKYLFPIYVILMVIVGYFILKKKPATTSTDSSGTGGLSGGSSGGSTNILDMLGLQNSTGNVDTTTTLATGLLNYQYKGQPLYQYYNNVAKPSDSIGYTATGVVIKMANVEWNASQSQYVDKSTPPYVPPIPSGATGLLEYTYNGQSLYSNFNGVGLPSNVVGYLFNGTSIYRYNVVFVNGEWRDNTSGYQEV